MVLGRFLLTFWRHQNDLDDPWLRWIGTLSRDHSKRPETVFLDRPARGLIVIYPSGWRLPHATVNVVNSLTDPLDCVVGMRNRREAVGQVHSSVCVNCAAQ